MYGLLWFACNNWYAKKCHYLTRQISICQIFWFFTFYTLYTCVLLFIFKSLWSTFYVTNMTKKTKKQKKIIIQKKTPIGMQVKYASREKIMTIYITQLWFNSVISNLKIKDHTYLNRTGWIGTLSCPEWVWTWVSYKRKNFKPSPAWNSAPVNCPNKQL